MTNFQCHYESLKVTPDAPPEVIRAAYRSLSQKHHPDKNGGNPEAARMMSRLNLAYSVLSDAVQRELYDLQRQHFRAQHHGFHEADAGDHVDDTPDGETREGGALFGSILRRAQARRGHVLAMIVGLLALGFAVAWWSIWNEQRTMLLLEDAARRPVAAPAVADAGAPGDAVAAPGVASAASGTAAASAMATASASVGADVPPVVARSSEYERLTALLKSMGLGLHRLDSPAPAPKRAAPPEPQQAAREAGISAAPRAPAGNPAPAAEPARARDEPPATAEPVRAEAKSAPEASRPGAAPAASAIASAGAVANANAESAAPRQPVIIDPRACAPVYPARAYGNGETGTVRMALLVGADGNVIEAKVRKSSGSGELDRAARKALSQCKFKVADSHAEPAWATLEYVFSLD